MKLEESNRQRLAITVMRWALGWLCCFVMLSAPSPLFAQSGAPSSTGGNGPLSEMEQWAALNGALDAGIAAGANTPSEASALRQEVLLVELHQRNESESLGRAADVYIYDYSTDMLHYTTVELSTGQAGEIQTVQGVQLPITQAEMDKAIQIAIGNTVILQLIEDAYAQQTGSQFTQLEQISIEAELFLAVAATSQVNMQSADCGIHRCALLTLKTSQGIDLGVRPVVDLSIEQVVQNFDMPSTEVAAPGDLGFSDTGNIIDESNAAPQLPTSSSSPSQPDSMVAVDSNNMQDPNNLGIVNPGGIIDESATVDQASTTVTASADASGAPSRQNDLGVVNPGAILNSTVAGPVGPTGPAGQVDSNAPQSDPNNLGFVDTGAILEESASEDNQQVTSPGAAKSSVFIPFMARRLFKSQPLGFEAPNQDQLVEVRFDQRLFMHWWCAVVAPSSLSKEVEPLCQP